MVDSASLPETSQRTRENDAAHEQLVARLRLLWDRRRLLFKATGYGLVIFTIIAFLIPKRYESTTLLMPPDDQSSSGMGMALAAALSGTGGGGLSGLAGDVLGMKSSGDLFIGILRSRTVQDELISKYDLRKIYQTKEWDPARKALTANTTISEDRKSGIIEIKVSDRSPQRAAALAQAYVSELNVVVSQLSTSSARRERVFLEQRLTQVKQDLEAAEKDFSEFSSKNATIDIKEQGRAMVDAAANLQGQLIATRSELEALKQIYSDNNVRIRSLKARAAELQSQLNKLGGDANIVSNSPNDDEGSLYPSIRKLPLLGVTYADLYRQSKVEEAVYDTLTQEYEMAKVAEAKEIPSVRVLDSANVPERKSSPPRLLIMLMGAFFCFAVTAIWIFARARWEEIDPLSPQRMLIQEILSTANSNMPWAPPSGSSFQRASHRVWLRLARRGSALDKSE